MSLSLTNGGRNEGCDIMSRCNYFMENMNNKFFILAFALLTSCCGGNKFKHVELKENESVVYFYRPDFAGCLRLAHKIIDKDTGNCIAVVPAGGYYPYVTTPGNKIFFRKDINGVAKTKLQMEAGNEYYIESTWDPYVLAILAKPMLRKVDEEDALEEIKNKKYDAKKYYIKN